jgi:hypothetical protein
MKSYNFLKQLLIVIFCIGMLNSCKKESISDLENKNAEISTAKISDLLTGGNSTSSQKGSKLAYRVFPNINLFPGGGSGPAGRSNSQPDNNGNCPISPGYLYSMSLISAAVGYNCNGVAIVNFKLGIEYLAGEPPGGVFATINGISFPAQSLSYNLADAQVYIVENVPYDWIVTDPCNYSNVNIGVNSGFQICGGGTGGYGLSVNYSMAPIGGGSNGGSWQPSTGYTTVIGQARLTVPIVICYTNPCNPGPPFANYTFRYKLENTTSWTEVTATYFQTQIGYIINNLPAGNYNLEGRDSASNPWVLGANGGVFTVL